MARLLDGKKVAILATDGFEESELTSPRAALEGSGAKVEVIAPHPGPIRGWKHRNWADGVEITAVVSQVDPAGYDALVLPGGAMNPDHLRMDSAAVQFVTRFFETGKPIAAICHGPWTLVETGHLKGRQVTSYRSIKTDLINAGAKWVDEPVVIDRGLLTSRGPEDLPAFNEKMIELFAAGPVPIEAPAPAPARRTQRKRPVGTRAARAKAPARRTAAHGKPRGQKQAPRRRAQRRH